MFASRGMAGVAAVLVLSGAALADPPVAASGPDAAKVEPAPVETKAALSSAELADLAGGQGVEVAVLTRQQLTGTTTGNTVTAGTMTSGAVNFAENALSGFSGVGNFVINTGANNTLQGAINISVVTAPGP